MTTTTLETGCIVRVDAPSRIPAAPARSGTAVGLLLADYITLAKPRISLLALFTVAAGFLLASAAVDWPLLGHTLLGTALVAIGASALNQVLERRSDAQMERTHDRPLPAGRFSVRQALRFGVLSAASGFVYLTLLANPLTGLLAVATLMSYVFLYTPLKRFSTLNTLVGAVPGALPPVLGWAAATGQLTMEAGSLFLILFVWQFPHFWAIAWIYRDDYARAGLQMVPVRDQTGGRMTGRLMVQHCLVLTVASIGPVLLHMAGPRYFFGAMVLGAMFFFFAFRFLLSPTAGRAKHVLWASLVYLPAIFTLLLLDG